MDIIDNGENRPPTPPREIEPIVSVRDREFCLNCPHPRTASLHPPSLDDALVAKHMPDLGHDIKEFQVFHWELHDWKELGKKLTSPEFDCGGHKWYGPPQLSPHLSLG